MCDAQGHAKSRRWPYSYRALADGTRIDESIRAVYPDFADDQHRRGVQVNVSVHARREQPRSGTGSANRRQGPHPGSPGSWRRSVATAPTLPSPTPISTTASADRILRWAQEHGQKRDTGAGVGDGRHLTGADDAARPVARSRGRASTTVPFALRGTPWGVNVIGCLGRRRRDRGGRTSDRSCARSRGDTGAADRCSRDRTATTSGLGIVRATRRFR